MNSPRQCGKCGRPLPTQTPEGLCPNCLLEVGALELGMASELPAADFKLQGSASGSTKSRAKIFGNYELLEKIGQGGMGVVYRARQLNLGRLVAVKLLPFGQFSCEDLVQRFRTEAAAAAALRHPNIVAIHDVGEHEGQQYFSMDLIAGHTLAEAVRDQPLPARRAAVYLKTIAEAVHYAHEHGVLHRDLKPSNVLIDESDQPHITDFGLAKRLSSPECRMESLELTFTGQVLGSPNFMSPEQAEGRPHAIGPAADIYSLGALLYHLLTRQPPFQADTLTTLLKQVIETDPVAPRLLNPSIPHDLETICLKCLEKEPSRRYPTALALAEDLGRYLENKPIQARPVGAVGKGWKWCRRRPALAGMTAAAVVILVLGLSGVLWQWRRATTNERRANANELFARQNAYAADTLLAQHAVEAENRGRALRLLEPYRPRAESEFDLRHWEWRYLWQLCQPDPCERLKTQSTFSGPAFISQNGMVMAVRTGHANIQVWDLPLKRQTRDLSGFDSSNILGLSADGALLALRRRDAPLLEVWNLAEGKLAAALDHPSVPTRSLAFSPDGRLLATFDHHSSNAIVRVIDWAARRTLTNFTVPPPARSEAGVVVFSPDGRRLAFGEDFGKIRIVHWPSGSVLSIETQTTDGVTSLAFSPDSQVLAAGFAYTSGTIRLWDVDSGEPRGQFISPNGWVRKLAFSPDGQRLASANYAGVIRIWSVADHAELHRFQGHQGVVQALSYLGDTQTLVSGGQGGPLCFWDSSAPNHRSSPMRMVVSPDSGKLAVAVVNRFGIAFTPDSKNFITTDTNGLLGLWDTETLRLTESLPGVGIDNWGVALSRDGHWLAAGNTRGTLHIWDWRERRRVASLDLPFQWSGFLRFSHSGDFLWAWVWFCDHKVKAKMWRTSDWEEVPLVPLQDPNIMSVDLSPDERHLAVGYADGRLMVWSFPEGQPEAAFSHGQHWVFGVRFSGDGGVLASTGSDGAVRLWDVVAQRDLNPPLPGHLGGSWGAVFSPDGGRLATGGGSTQDGRTQDAVKLWDLATRRELLTLAGDGQFFTDLTFSPDGNTLVATCLTGIAHFWRAPSWEQIAAAEKDR